MKWYCNNWYYVGGVLFIIQAFILILFESDMEFLTKMMCLSFMALNVHQFEEYAIPGGFPMVMNMAFMEEKEVPERYPLNKKSAFVCNVCCIYPIYILAIIFSQQLWLGLAVVIMGVAQIFVHGIAFNKKLGTIYNPGIASIIFLFVPLCGIYIWYIVTSCEVLWWHWLIALILQPVLGMGCLMFPIQKLKDKCSPDAWTEDEVKRFAVADKLEKKHK